jgi:hypothetical protein
MRDIKIRSIRIIKRHPIVLGVLVVVLAGGGTGIYHLATLAPGNGSGNSATTARHPVVPGKDAGLSGQGGGAVVGQWADFLIPDTVVMCQDDQGGITLSAISMTTGRIVASREISLPSEVTQSQSCTSTTGETSMFPVRQMFDRTFTHMAVLVSDPPSNGQLAAVLNLQTGQVASLSAPGGFTSAPQQQRPQFDPVTQMVWYADPTSTQIGEFAPGAREAEVKAQSYASSVAVANGNFWPAIGSDWAISPDGKHIVITNDLDPLSGMYLAGPGAILSDGVDINSGSTGVESFGGDSGLPGSDLVECSAPAAWLDSTHLLCYDPWSDSNFGLVTFSATMTSVAGFRPNLLPATDRTNVSAVSSPDGRSFAFLSLEGNILSLYRESLVPGSIPVKIADVSTGGDSPQFPSPLQWN